MGMDIENIDTEWKESWSSKYLKTIAAFYNTEGGCMIIGRRDDGTYIGVPDIKKETKVVADSIRDKLHIISNTYAESIDGKDCIVIKVPKGDKMVDYDGRFYMRVGNTTQQIENDELKKLLLSENGLQWLDQPCDLTIDDISKKAVSYFIKKAKSVKRIPSSVKSSDIDGVLKRFNLLYDGKPTLGAAVLFSDDPMRFNSGAYVKIGVFDSKDLLVRDECFYGPMISMPDRVIEALYDKYIPPRYGFGNGSASRYYIYDYPEDAVRELLVNAIAHMDFSKQEPITIRVYPDKMRIFSFGGLPKGWDVYKLTHSRDSVRRNKHFSEVFYAIGLVENWGQGITKVLEVCKSNGNPVPEFNSTSEGLEAFIYPISSGSPKIRASTSSKIVLDGKARAIIECIIQNQSVTIKQISITTGIPVSTVEKRLSKLSSEGVLSREGSDKAGRWIINEELL